MELRQLRYFVKVAETLNFSEAAKALFVTQSTLSQQVRQLEDEFGTPLLDRNSHSVALTEAGRELLPYARRTLADADQCAARLADLNDLATGQLSIGVTYSFSPILTETLLTFMHRYPHIKLDIYYRPMAELMLMLQRREVDFVLAFKPSQPVDGVESHILFQSYLAAIVSSTHPLASLGHVTLDDMTRYDVALPARGLQARNAFDRIAGSRQLRLRAELNEVNILLELIRNSNLVTVLAEATIHNATGVKAIRLDVPSGELQGCVHTLRDTYRKRSMLEFVRMLGESVAVCERRNAWL
ncbi:MAG: LysR substrate-binding domain-containing protein [Bacteroidales bacterium]|nr:LysR substrate-binding domain-containing protein [Bacteroidales bacterium]